MFSPEWLRDMAARVGMVLVPELFMKASTSFNDERIPEYTDLLFIILPVSYEKQHINPIYMRITIYDFQ